MRHPLSPIDENRHLNCLTAVSDVGLAAEVLELCSGEIRTQNAPYLLGAMLRNRAIGALTWSFIQEHFADFTERFPANSIHRMLDGVTGLVAVDPGDGVPSAGRHPSVLHREYRTRPPGFDSSARASNDSMSTPRSAAAHNRASPPC